METILKCDVTLGWVCQFIVILICAVMAQQDVTQMYILQNKEKVIHIDEIYFGK